MKRLLWIFGWFGLLSLPSAVGESVDVEGQPLGANLLRVAQALDYLGTPWPEDLVEKVAEAARARDAKALQELIDPQVLLSVEINPERRVKVRRGSGKAVIQQSGFTPLLIKVENHATATQALDVGSPQAGAVYAGASLAILKRQAQTELNQEENVANDPDRFLQVEVFRDPPMTPRLSGLDVEYVILLVSSSEAGKREALLQADIGQGTQDLGFRSEVPVLFDVQPAVRVGLKVRDVDGTPTTARLRFEDQLGRVYPPQAKRLAPDLFFQPHIYRADGESVLLPPGKLVMTSCRGPEYREVITEIHVKPDHHEVVTVPLERWIDPMALGYYVGDHHIHGAGCSHYTSPTEGVLPEHVFQQVKGEGLNVGSVLTWGPCYDYQRRFFEPKPNDLSESKTLIKYDVEVSGFGSAPLGHVCLLNLLDQTYPGSDERKDRGWPSWTVPVMRWCQEQGGVTGYPHSAMYVHPEGAAGELIMDGDADGDGTITQDESKDLLLPYDFARIDTDRDGRLQRSELELSVSQSLDELPNLAIPSMDGSGAMEIFVSMPEGVCDFISAMDTARIPEWNTWYHLMNCGFPLKLAGETDFPCMSSRRVGQGRTYVQLGSIETLDYATWVKGLAAGRSYVSDGYAHALAFSVNDVLPGQGEVTLDKAGTVQVTAQVAFAAEVPRGVAYGNLTPPSGRRMAGDTVNLHAPRSNELTRGSEHLVEVVVNGSVVASHTVPGDGREHALTFAIPLEQSSWVALRSFPQLHTNPVTVLIADRPIRASKASAQWCETSVTRLWKHRSRFIQEEERPAARAAYDRALERYRQIGRECSL